MRPRVVVLIALLATACSAPTEAAAPPPPPTPTGPSPELVTWVDKVCGTTVTAIAPLQTQPTLDQNSATKMKTQFLDYLTKSSQSLGQGLTDLQGLVSGPSKDSARYVESHTNMLTTLKDSLDKSEGRAELHPDAAGRGRRHPDVEHPREQLDRGAGGENPRGRGEAVDQLPEGHQEEVGSYSTRQ
jgi:hypothetical protein